MRILVTGASGLLGLNLALEAVRCDGGGNTVYGTVNNHRIRTEEFQVIQTDLTAPGTVEKLLDTTRPDWVINCAALASVDRCESEPELAHKMNVELPAILAKHVARGGARLVHVSTDSVFDGRRGDYCEEDEPNPLVVYSKTKLEGERAVAEADPSAIIARVNIVGWSLGGSRSLAEFFYYNLVAGKRVNGFTDLFFCPLLANDLSCILLRMLELRLSGLYHVVSRQCTSKYDFGAALARKFGLDESMIDPVSVEKGGLLVQRAHNLYLRSDKLARTLGSPLPDIAEAIDGLYKLHREGYAAKLKCISA
jgi:dTDP-4-dehydrorhamnose reductase